MVVLGSLGTQPPSSLLLCNPKFVVQIAALPSFYIHISAKRKVEKRREAPLLPHTHPPSKDTSRTLNTPIPLISSWPELSQRPHLWCDRLHFPKVASEISPVPCALQQCDLATPPSRVEALIALLLNLGGLVTARIEVVPA